MSVFARWTAFNLVGVLGVAVQLGVLALLVRVAELPVPLATALAVEAAILHNFAWHQRWTWGHRPAADSGEVLRRLWRFHALNGTVSLVGNVAITWGLTTVGIDLVLANCIAILSCSTVNFFAGDRLVFRAGAAAVVLALAVHAPSAAAGDTIIGADGPSPAALAAWNKYVATIDARYWNASGEPFFTLDARRSAGWRKRAMEGATPMVEIDPPAIPDAKLHHWAGAIYVPNTTVEAVMKRMQDYGGRESEFYEEVKASKLLERDGNKLRVFMRLHRGAYGVDATFNSEHAVEYRRISGMRGSSRSVSTKMAELANANTPREREKPAGTDSGFLWRLNAYWRFEQAGDGVLIECESVSLSRGVPWGLRPFISGVVEGLAKDSLQRTLRSLRTFLVRTTAPAR